VRVKWARVREETWEKLMLLKIAKRYRSLDEAINALLSAQLEPREELERKHASLLRAKRVFEDLLSCPRRKMFTIVTRTWNPVTGCTHLCRYCWARDLAAKLRGSSRYGEGFAPKLVEKELRATFKPGEAVFVSDMGDLFCEGVPDAWIKRVLERAAEFPETRFLFLTKNPARYATFLDLFPPGSALGATIETNKDELYREHAISRAPPPSERCRAMRDLRWERKFVSVEPILDFDLDEFARWIADIAPFLVYVGYDNYGHRLPEPPLAKALDLVERLGEFTVVLRKTLRPAWYETSGGGERLAAGLI